MNSKDTSSPDVANKSSLFEPFQLGPLTLKNRMVMAPLTRSRATGDGIPTEMMEVYYAQRATAGLIISEGVVISPQGVAYPRVPGLYSNEQVEAWKPITEAVHKQGGLIFAQLWHVGRQSHSSVQPDSLPPQAPSPIAIKNYKYNSRPIPLAYETPRELTLAGIQEIIKQYADAAARAIDAGFDGVELHGANGYLIDQFLNSASNQRTDSYGGSVENRMRFLVEILQAIARKVPLNRVGVRLSPSSTWMDAVDLDKYRLHSAVVKRLDEMHIAYLHLVEPRIAGSTTIESSAGEIPVADLANLFSGTVIATGEHDLGSATMRINEGVADLVGFGRYFISNPDLPERMQSGAPLIQPDRKTFYSGRERGYITYPSLAAEQRWQEYEDAFSGGYQTPAEVKARLEPLSWRELEASNDLFSLSQINNLVSLELS